MDYFFDALDRFYAEDERFRHASASGLAWSCEVDRISLERSSLAGALGEDDTQVVNQLYAHGLRTSTVAVVEWILAVETAWADGTDETDRQAVLAQFAADDRASDAGIALLDRWLATRPSESLMAAGRRALRSHLQTLEDDDRKLAVARVRSNCEAVGRAATGTIGKGARSRTECRRIDSFLRELERPA